MDIVVNGTPYPDWDGIAADLRQRIAGSQPDTDGSGIPDAFEGEGRVEATVSGDTVEVSSSATSTSSTSSTSVTVGGQDVTSLVRRIFRR